MKVQWNEIYMNYMITLPMEKSYKFMNLPIW